MHSSYLHWIYLVQNSPDYHSCKNIVVFSMSLLYWVDRVVNGKFGTCLLRNGFHWGCTGGAFCDSEKTYHNWTQGKVGINCFWGFHLFWIGTLAFMGFSISECGGCAFTDVCDVCDVPLHCLQSYYRYGETIGVDVWFEDVEVKTWFYVFVQINFLLVSLSMLHGPFFGIV